MVCLDQACFPEPAEQIGMLFTEEFQAAAFVLFHPGDFQNQLRLSCNLSTGELRQMFEPFSIHFGNSRLIQETEKFVELLDLFPFRSRTPRAFFANVIAVASAGELLVWLFASADSAEVAHGKC